MAFPAKFRGRCVACQYWFGPGVTIERSVVGYIHAKCPDDPTDGEAADCAWQEDDGPPRDFGDL